MGAVAAHVAGSRLPSPVEMRSGVFVKRLFLQLDLAGGRTSSLLALQVALS